MEHAMITAAIDQRPRPAYWIIPGLGLAWNAFGLYQFISSVTSSREHLLAMGMTPEQVAVYTGVPGWMTAAFAVGVLGGLLGCLLLALRSKAATPVLALSLAAYVVLYIGDITEGVFAAFGLPQIAILTSVVLIAAALLAFGARAHKHGLLA
jgi:hypothetical protein